MSLTVEQQENTIEEFKENVALTGLTTEQIALDLHTDTATIERILQLSSRSIEDPWIVKNYLTEKIMELGKEPIPFSALVGDYHDYWFLNAKKIDRKKIR